MKDVFLFGTCRICYLDHKNINLIKVLREHHSRYYTIGDDIHIYTQPVNYTTKLSDALDSILYMKGKLYADLNAYTNRELQGIFFRGHKTNGNVINPATHPYINNRDIIFTKVVIEVFSIKQYIINTKKYGESFYLKNLPWKLTTGHEQPNDILFDKDDFICKTMSKGECFEVLDRINKEVGCEILIIGPYVSALVPEHVNIERVKTQEILKEYCSLHGNTYFDLSEAIQKDTIEIDQTHFNSHGNKLLTDVIYSFIMQ